MPRLTSAELRSRYAFDHRTVAGLSRETLGSINAYASLDELRANRPLSAERARLGDATAYAVEYRFPHLVGRGVTATSALAVFDLAFGGNYPFTAPRVAFASRPLPWSPHVQPSTGLVCLGDGWTLSGGQVLFAHLIVHVMRLLNFDEPRRTVDAIWNASAERYWHDVLRRGPYLPELRYPRLPTSLTHGVEVARSDAEDGGFRPAGGAP